MLIYGMYIYAYIDRRSPTAATCPLYIIINNLIHIIMVAFYLAYIKLEDYDYDVI